ncbi:cyclic lactone autoinducer peptide AgrD [Staphylococcus argenteus]|uniref:AgrD n=1 Tax=Staphylococcus argenteus TaxID=985002 RepID=A0A7H9SJ06_9STAP|nr:cyclic lactone autoinducer peptide [Staphylococcus argenteus]MBE2133619.1 cyclic lactone autoinducer peptide [Staphylococcus argenteus]MBE2137076.1 cyclic lactone autoinducer peptide [Staphylococcus argenteus]MBE2146372.1 cyclic lactone autoinducer peptide [Staphylococcus argenteus]MBE2161683.1 cyclic lactone autoinducer peptide [Staphylococcus argenteus]MCG9798089.1 cyclic lactone autoinducer peptide [Staphylococcus argenteus]
MKKLINMFIDILVDFFNSIGYRAALINCDFLLDEAEVPKELTQLHE